MEFPEIFAKGSEWTESIVAKTSPGQYANATPCAEWDVRALLNHIIGGTHFFTMVLTNQQPPEGEMPDLVGDDPAGAYRAGADAYSALLADPANLEGTVNPPWGETPTPAFIGLSCIDTLAHGWDLATATGQDATIPSDLLDPVFGFARQALAVFPRSPEIFDTEVSVADDADASSRFAAFLGRTP